MISAKPWSLEAVAFLFLGVITTFCAGMFAAGLLEVWKYELAKRFGMSDDHRKFLELLIMVAFFQGAALVWIAGFLRWSKISWRQAFGLRPSSRLKVIASGICVGVCILPTAWFLQLVSQLAMEHFGLRPAAQQAVEELQNSSLSIGESVVMGLFSIVLAPIAEEALFRGIMYPTIKQMGHPRLALWITSVLFGIMHGNMAALVPLVFLATVLVFLYESSESLLAPIATHGMFNAANFCYLVFADPIHRLLHLQ